MFIQMNKCFFLALTVLFISSCSDKNEYEIINSEEVLPQSQGNYEYSGDSLVSEIKELNPTERTLLAQFPDISFEDENPLKEREMLFMPNRLGFSEKKEVFFTKDSIPFHFIEWTFEDSLKTVNAFYNWIDCFGTTCRSIRIDEEINGSKEAFVIWISNSKISYLASSKNINRRSWQDVLTVNEKKEWNYIIHQAPRGKMNWLVSAIPKVENKKTSD